MAGMDFDFEGALGGGFDSPGVFSYGQYNQEQMMQNPNAIKSLGLLGKLQESQLNQQKKVMEIKKMEEDRQMEMLMKQAVAEASKQGPDAIASVYEQFGDAKTAMDIRQSAMALKKGGLEVNKLLTDQESAKRAAIMNQVASRIASLPANQRAQEWANLIPQVNAQMGTEIPENYSSGNLMGLMAVQRGVQDGLQTILSNPQTASMAEQPLRAMADPATEKYFNDLIAAKKTSQGPDLVTRANQMPEDPNFEAQRKQVREQIDARDKAAYEADFYKYKLDPETEKAKEQAQYELGQEANAEAQALSNALAELSAKEKPTAADVARVQAMADSLYETQTPLVARDFNRGKEAPASPETQQTKTFTTKTDKDGNISFSESVKEAPAKDDGGVSAAMAGLTQSLQGLDLPPSTWEDPEKSKPLSNVGKLQYDAARAKTPEQKAQLDAAAAKAAETGGGININTGEGPAMTKKLQSDLQTKLFKADFTLKETKNLKDVVNTNFTKWSEQGLFAGNRLLDKVGLASEEGKAFITEFQKTKQALENYLMNSVVDIAQSTFTDSLVDRLREIKPNLGMSPTQLKASMEQIINDNERYISAYKENLAGQISQLGPKKEPYKPTDSDFEKVLSIYDDPNATPEQIKKADAYILKYGSFYK